MVISLAIATLHVFSIEYMGSWHAERTIEMRASVVGVAVHVIRMVCVAQRLTGTAVSPATILE